MDLTLIDSSGKKTDFIKSAAEKTGINVTVIAARAEEAARYELRENFFAAVSRAVAPLNILLELCAPFVKTEGVFAAWKGENYKQELKEANSAVKALGLRFKSQHEIGPGALLLFSKYKPSPTEYPRRYSKIKSSPL